MFNSEKEMISEFGTKIIGIEDQEQWNSNDLNEVVKQVKKWCDKYHYFVERRYEDGKYYITVAPGVLSDRGESWGVEVEGDNECLLLMQATLQAYDYLKDSPGDMYNAL